MKTTTTLYEIIRSEWLNKGNNEFVNNGRLTFYDRDYNIMDKIIVFDKDVEEIVNHMFFRNVSLDSPSSDKLFKRTWLERFMEREIMYQTVETFASKNVYTFLTYQTFLNKYYDELDMYLNGEYENFTQGTTDNITQSDTRFLSSSLPQNEINLNVDNTELAYGDTNNLTRQKNDSNNISNTDNKGKNLNLDNLLKIHNLLEPIYDQFDSKCFLQVW